MTQCLPQDSHRMHPIRFSSCYLVESITLFVILRTIPSCYTSGCRPQPSLLSVRYPPSLVCLSFSLFCHYCSPVSHRTIRGISGTLFRPSNYLGITSMGVFLLTMLFRYFRNGSPACVILLVETVLVILHRITRLMSHTAVRCVMW